MGISKVVMLAMMGHMVALDSPATYVTELASCFVNSVLQMTEFSPSANSNINRLWSQKFKNYNTAH